jgi:hypothetical protein
MRNDHPISILERDKIKIAVVKSAWMVIYAGQRFSYRWNSSRNVRTPVYYHRAIALKVANRFNELFETDQFSVVKLGELSRR